MHCRLTTLLRRVGAVRDVSAAADLRPDLVRRRPGRGVPARARLPRVGRPPPRARPAGPGRPARHPSLRDVLAATGRRAPVRDRGAAARRALGLALPHAGALLLRRRRPAPRRLCRRPPPAAGRRPRQGPTTDQVAVHGRPHIGANGVS